MAPDACVVGSLNLNLVAFVDRAPGPGETRTGTAFRTVPGGKGANQAAAAAALGLRTALVGRVGRDAFGPGLVHELEARGVDTRGVREDPDATTGTAVILVEENGQNRIVVVPGANGRVDESDLARVPEAGLLLLQLEIPLPTVTAAARQGHDRGACVVLNPAPAVPLPDALLTHVDVVVVNEVEAEMLTGVRVDETSLPRIASWFHTRGTPTVVVTLGPGGAFAARTEETVRIAAPAVDVVDTTAAGDAFVGGLTAGLHQGASLHDAVSLGVAAGSLTVTRAGAQTSIPSRGEVEAFLSTLHG